MMIIKYQTQFCLYRLRIFCAAVYMCIHYTSTLALLSTHQPEALVTSAAEMPLLMLPCRAIKSDLEVTARHLNEVEAVQHVYLTNIPVWFGLLGDI